MVLPKLYKGSIKSSIRRRSSVGGLGTMFDVAYLNFCLR